MNKLLLSQRKIGLGAARTLPGLVRDRCDGSRVLLVADENTWAAAGEIVAAALEGEFTLSRYLFPAGVEAAMANVIPLQEAAKQADLLVSIGSGTINDLTKYTASQMNLPYIAFATAASMNGYSSATASLTADGYKSSHAAASPFAVVADLDILAASPSRLTRAGIGDTFCRSSVEVDMLLSHYVRDTEYPKAVFERLRAREAQLLQAVDGLKQQTHKAMALLMETLLDSGDAMASYGSSATASQGEHVIAHVLEMWHPHRAHQFLHGEQIAVTTLTMARIQEYLIQRPPVICTLTHESSVFAELFGKDMAEGFLNAHRMKQFRAEDAAATQSRVQRQWLEIRAAISAIQLPTSQLEEFLVAVGAPSMPEDIGFTREEYDRAVQYAYLTRDRFTFLDLAAMRKHQRATV